MSCKLSFFSFVDGNGAGRSVNLDQVQDISILQNNVCFHFEGRQLYTIMSKEDVARLTRIMMGVSV